MVNSILDKILEIKDTLPNKQKKICDYITINHSKVITMTVAELAHNADVGTTTVMRFIKSLGYDSYNDFKRDLINANIILDNSIYVDLKQSLTTEQNDSSIGNILQSISVVASNLLTISNLEQIEKTVDLLLNAKTIYSLGLRSSACVSEYFEISVHPFITNIKQLSRTPDYLFDNLLNIKPTDVLFIVSEWPCTKDTVDFAKLCNEKNIPIALLTNTKANPIARFANTIIDTNSVGEKIGRIPSMIVVEALANELGIRTGPKSVDMVNELENMLKEKNIFLWN